MRLGLGLGFSSGVNRWSPSRLFASGEPGGWYDIDPAYLYQDSAGTTPVTAPGQTVGLMLDRSKGLVLGSEQIVNGTFATDSDWTKINGATISGGVANLFNAAANPAITQTRNFTLGKTYLVSLTWTGTISAGMGAYGSGDVRFITSSSAGSFTGYITLSAGTGATFWVSAPVNVAATVDNISVKELPGNHLTQSTLSNRPLYQVDGNGRGYLQFDGSDDWLVSPTITPGIDKAQVFAGVRKLSDAAIGMVVEASASIGSNNGTVAIYAPTSGGTATYQWLTKGTGLSAAPSPANYASPITNVLTGIGDIAADTAILRVNGTQVATSTTDQGTGNYLAYPLYVGRRGGTTLPYNGRLYSLIVRFGANLDAATIAATEAYVNSKTGAY